MPKSSCSRASWSARRRRFPDKPAYRDALMQQVGSDLGTGQRNFFQHTVVREPLGLYSHFYHWIELARIENEPHPSPVRRAAPFYNIFDTRSEGLATAMEEILMHGGLYDELSPSRSSSALSRAKASCPSPSSRISSRRRRRRARVDLVSPPSMGHRGGRGRMGSGASRQECLGQRRGGRGHPGLIGHQQRGALGRASGR